MKSLFSKLLVFVLVAVAVFSLCSCKAPDSDGSIVSQTEITYDNTVLYKHASQSDDGYATVYVPNERNAKILLLADPQLDITEKYSIVGCSNALTITFLEKLLDAVSPDLTVIAGDLTMTNIANNWGLFCQIADVFESKKQIWSFTFGNHDCENAYVTSFGQRTKEELIAKTQEKYDYCLINSSDCEDGEGNHFINVRNKDGKLLNTVCNLDCLYEGDGYSNVISEKQTEWYVKHINAISDNELGAERTSVIPSIAVTHVAMPETFISCKQAFDENKKPIEGKYYYGHLLGGDYSKYAGKTSFYSEVKRLGSTKAFFFGHHHNNDISTEYEGIRFTFVQHSGLSHEYRTEHSISYALIKWLPETVFDFTLVDTYGDKRGGTLVEVSQDTTYSISPVYAAEVIPDYADWAIDYDEVERKITEEFGEGHVIR